MYTNITAEPLLFISFIGALLLFAGFTVAYLYQLYKKEKEIKQKEIEIYKNSEQIIKHAHERAKNILEKAVQKAEGVLLESEYLDQNIKKDIREFLKTLVLENEKELKDESQNFLKTYRGFLQNIQGKYADEMVTMVDEIRDSAEVELEEFRDRLKQETVGAQKDVSEKISQEFVQAQKEVEEYKKQQITRVEESLNKIILYISGEVLGRAIPADEQEKLVLKALDQAKSEGILQSL